MNLKGRQSGESSEKMDFFDGKIRNQHKFDAEPDAQRKYSTFPDRNVGNTGFEKKTQNRLILDEDGRRSR